MPDYEEEDEDGLGFEEDYEDDPDYD